jgi:putative transposase
MPRMYPATVRRQIVARLRSGEPFAAVAAETGICQATLFRWKHQAAVARRSSVAFSWRIHVKRR